MTSDVDIARAAITAGFSAVQVPTAVAIALAESGGDATRQTTLGRGLWQITAGEVGQDWADPSANARAAKAGFDRLGWSYWPSWRSNRYLLFMPRGALAATLATAGNIPGQLPDINVPNPLEPVQELASTATGALRTVTDRDLWIRVGIGLLGAFLIVAAGIALIWSFAGRGVVKTAKKII